MLTGEQDCGMAVISAPPDEAERIARRLVEERLAACAQVSETVKSIYWWQGVMHEDPEGLIFLKTTSAALPAIQRLLSQIHPYEVAELVFLPITWGSQSYLEWLKKNVRS